MNTAWFLQNCLIANSSKEQIANYEMILNKQSDLMHFANIW